MLHNIDNFCIKKVGEVWLLASPILITFILGTSNKVQGGLFTSYSSIDYLYTGNQQLMQKLEETVPESVRSIKYLGVKITNDFRWNTYISNICTKANRTLSLLRRNLYA